MNWLFLAVIAYFIWAIVGILDGILAKKYIKNPLVLLFIGSFLTGFLPLIIIPFTGLKLISLPYLILALLAGLVFVYGLLPYFTAMTIEEVSRIGPLWHLIPVFVLVISGVFLKDPITSNQYIGFFLLVTGGFLLSLKKARSLFKLSRALGLMLISTFLMAIYFVLTKYVFTSQNFIDAFLWIRIGTVLGALSLLLMRKHREEFIFTFFRLKKSAKLILFLDRILDVLALTAVSYAIMLGPVAIINSLEGVQSFFTIVIMVFISIKFPTLLKEEISRGIIFCKIIAIIMMIAGIYFINL